MAGSIVKMWRPSVGNWEISRKTRAPTPTPPPVSGVVNTFDEQSPIDYTQQKLLLSECHSGQETDPDSKGLYEADTRSD